MEPSFYKPKLFLLLLVGYCCVFLPVVILAALASLLVWTIVTGNGLSGWAVLVQIALIILAGRLVKALRFKHPHSSAVAIDEKEAPKLFETIREIRKAVHGPSIHKVILSEQFELSLTPVPRLGLYGWSRNYLDVGLPLLLGLSPAQFRARLAHELSHQSGGHLGSLIYRNRELWLQLTTQLQTHTGLGRIFARLFYPFARYFRDYSLAFARSREYEADRRAAMIATAEAMADALIRSEYGQALYWECSDDFAEDVSNELPPAAGFAETFRRALESELENERLLFAIERSLAAKASPYDSHPALKDRLLALGQEVRLPTHLPESAADALLGDRLTQFIDEQTRAWEERSERYWRDDRSPASETLKRAYEAEAAGDDEAALRLYREALQTDPEFATALLGIGRILIRDDNPEGIDYLERAMQLDMRNTSHGCSLIITYLMKVGDGHRTAPYQRRMTEFSRFLTNSDTERSLVSFVDRFVSHDMPQSEVEELRHELSKHERIRAAYLARKEVQYFPEQPLYVLGLVVDRGSDEDLSFAHRLPRASTLPVGLYTFKLDNRNKRVEKIFRNLGNSQIYERANRSA